MTFTCPLCGSHFFGTSGCTGPEHLMRGHCHGGNCNFTWSRAEDDKYFEGLDEEDEFGEGKVL